MDEPLSNLDAKLRQQTRRELALLHRELKPTIIYVTHDQIEAMTMATRIVVMNEGYIQQVGTPYEIYNKPANIFTAGFIGMPSMNKIEGIAENGRWRSLPGETGKYLVLPLPQELRGISGAVTAGIRPEHITMADNAAAYRTGAIIKSLELLGAEYNAELDINGQGFVCRFPVREGLNPGKHIEVSIDAAKVHFFDLQTGVRLNRG
jgi:multiple sugar transport system ATP-binding protein